MTTAVRPKFQYLRANLANMAELALEQVLWMGDALEHDNHDLCAQIIERDDLIDELEKENDNISQTAILEAVATRREMGMEDVSPDAVLKHDPLRFALSAIRITRNLERLSDNVVNAARAFMNRQLRPEIFGEHEPLGLILSRVTTIVGMAVESLIEEKDRFFGSIQAVDGELDRRCQAYFEEMVQDSHMSHHAFADLYRILLSLERVGDLAVNVAEELVRLSTGQDVRHLDNRSDMAD